MNFDEASRIFRNMGTAFPPIQDYINKINDWPATKEIWAKMLISVRYEDAVAAVDRFITGEAEPPQASWEIGMLPLHIRGVAGRVAQDRARVAEAQRSKELTMFKSQRCGSDNLKSVFAFWRAANICHRKGLIDDNQLNEFWQDVLRFNKNSGQPIVVPTVLSHEFKVVLSGKSKAWYENVIRSA